MTQKSFSNLKSNQKSTIIKQIVSFLFVTIIIIYSLNFQYSQSTLTESLEEPLRYALLGDIGGTNIRLQIVKFRDSQRIPQAIIKEQRMKVKDFHSFSSTIDKFLDGLPFFWYPSVAIIAIAGPIQGNTVVLSNVPKWGKINGDQLAQQHGISHFRFINDFQAISYGLLIVQDSQIVSLNGKKIDQNKIRGVIGPGTGLGHSILFRSQFVQDFTIVLPSEAGQADFPLIDQESVHYFQFLKEKLQISYITLQKSFSGPTIPFMFDFYSQKLKNKTYAMIGQTPQHIISESMKPYPQPLYQKTFDLFMKFYSTAIGNFIAQHMTTGGIYLVGGLTKSIISKIKNTDILKAWKDRHPQLKKNVQEVPIVFCEQVDLGLKGAFVLARRLSRQVNKRKQSQIL